MSKKTLSIIETAYRATIEEQDDTCIWISHTFKGAGAELDVLLRGNAVNYACRGQDASGLAFGDKKQTQPPRIERDVASLIEKGVTVYLVEDDIADRGIERTDLIDGVTPIARSAMAELFSRYQQIWHW